MADDTNIQKGGTEALASTDKEGPSQPVREPSKCDESEHGSNHATKTDSDGSSRMTHPESHSRDADSDQTNESVPPPAESGPTGDSVPPSTKSGLTGDSVPPSTKSGLTGDSVPRPPAESGLTGDSVPPPAESGLTGDSVPPPAESGLTGDSEQPPILPSTTPSSEGKGDQIQHSQPSEVVNKQHSSVSVAMDKDKVIEKESPPSSLVSQNSTEGSVKPDVENTDTETVQSNTTAPVVIAKTVSNSASTNPGKDLPLTAPGGSERAEVVQEQNLSDASSTTPSDSGTLQVAGSPADPNNDSALKITCSVSSHADSDVHNATKPAPNPSPMPQPGGNEAQPGSASFDDLVHKLAAGCARSEVTVVLNAVINLEDWNVQYSIDVLKKCLLLRTSKDSWKGNSALFTDATLLSDAVYHVRTALVVKEHLLVNGMEYKYYLQVEPTKYGREKKHSVQPSYEFLHLDEDKNFNRVLLMKNIFWESDRVFCQHYDHFLLPMQWKQPSQKSKSFYENFKALFTRQSNNSLSYLSNSLIVYLDIYSDSVLAKAGMKPSLLQQNQILQLSDRLFSIFHQLHVLDIREHKHQGSRIKEIHQLKDTLAEWIEHVVPRFLPDDSTSPETLPGKLAAGLVLLRLAVESRTLYQCPGVLHILDLCQRPADCVLSSVSALREALSCSANTYLRWRGQVSTDLAAAVSYLAQPKTDNGRQCLLGVLLFLSLWTDLDDNTLFELRTPFTKPDIGKIHSAVSSFSDEMPWIVSSYMNARHHGLVKHCPKIKEVILQIAPLTAWPMMVEAELLPLMLKVLPMRLPEHYFAKHEVVEAALDQFISASQQLIEDNSVKWKPEDLGISQCTLKIATFVLSGGFKWPTRLAAVRLCLCICSWATYGPNHLKDLGTAVNFSIAKAVSTTHGHRRPGIEAVFGASCEHGYEMELAIWMDIVALTRESWVNLNSLSDWRSVCFEHILQRHGKLDFEHKLALLEVLERSQSSQSPELGKALVDGTLKQFLLFDSGKQDELVKSHSGESGHFRQIMIKFLKNRCPDPEKVNLDHLCRWTMWSCFFRVFMKQKDDSLDMESFWRASQLLETTVSDIQDSSITVEVLDIICSSDSNVTNFCELVSCLNADLEPNILRGRLMAFRKMLQIFSDEYGHILKLTKDGRLLLSQEGKVEREAIVKFELSLSTTPIIKLRDCLMNCCPDGLFEELLKMSKRFNNCFEFFSCKGIIALWSGMCPPCDLTTLVRDVWPQFQGELQQLVEEWKSGAITCARADSYMPHANEKEELYMIVGAMNAACKVPEGSNTNHPEDWITPSVQKLKYYRKAKSQHTAALTLINLTAILKVTSTFTALQSIVHMAQWDCKPLSSISNEMALVVEFLGLPHDDLMKLSSCAEALTSCADLIAWIKADAKHVGELRTFIHMAQMAHCEDASTRDCLANLKVILKLSPFIFEVKPDCTLLHLVECCKSVMAEKLHSVPEALGKCSRSLDKYKEIQKTLGSIGETVYGQVRDLVNRGRFTLQAPADGMCSSIQDLVMVRVPSGATKQQYSCSDLLDLQSKLALIRDEYIEDTSNQEGQGTEPDSERENVKDMAECFWEGLELTVRGADALLELLVAGHTPSRKYKLSYRLTEHVGYMSIQELKAAVQSLEQQLNNWRDKIEKARSEYYELNYFTARQLSMICQELSLRTGSNTREPLPLWFTNLMQSVSPVVNREDILPVINSMIEDKQEQNFHVSSVLDQAIDAAGDSSDDDNSESASKSSSILTIDELNESEKKLFDELTQQEYNTSVILRGITLHGCDFDAVVDFCLNSCSEIAIMSPQEPDSICLPDSSPRTDEHTTSEATDAISQIIAHGYDSDFAKEAHQLFPNDLDGALEYCLENESYYLEREDNVDTVQDETFEYFAPVQDEEYPEDIVNISIAEVPDEDFWTLTEIAQFLYRISQIHSEDGQSAFPCPRSFSTTGFALEADSPNLLIVPRSDIFRTVLSLYMYSQSESLPLPTGEEVLYCHSQTTAEEIRLLWRRAVGDPGCKRIFCLVCEHSLPHKVAKEAVQDMRKLLRNHRDFRIVVICCEDEGASLLVGDLREYKRSTPSLPNELRIVKYLQMHLCEPRGSSVLAGCDIDPEGSYVRVITSARAGMGKSLYVRRLIKEHVRSTNSNASTEDLLKVVTLHGPEIDRETIVQRLMSIDKKCCDSDEISRLYHFDTSGMLLEAVGAHMFCILILGTLQSSRGDVWRRRRGSLYAVEIVLPKQGSHEGNSSSSSDLFHLLPTTYCRSPAECLEPISKLKGSNSHLKHAEFIEMDEDLHFSSPYQRAYQYLHRYSQGQSVDNFDFVDGSVEGVSSEWIRLITRHSGIKDPTWAELSHFVSFLNNQLAACEKSDFCQSSNVSQESMGVTGFKSFVVKFMIRMSVDFTVPSIKSEVEPSRKQLGEDESPELEGYQIVPRRAWEFSVHPYIFFNREAKHRRENEEHYTMTFVGINLHQVGKSINLVNLENQIIEKDIMTEGLYRWLRVNDVQVRQNVSEWNKLTILKILCRVLESKIDFDADQNDFYLKYIDPDPTYELTFDNLVKILAIQMRFRCGIPVVIMGETGCGKTRLIRYMCQLQSYLAADPSKLDSVPPGQTFFIMKMHGGVSEKDIAKFLSQVRKDARQNQKQGFSTMVFFDEANTSDAIGLIKEVMCDGRIRGQPITEDIKFIAACNPYKKHSGDMIKKLESAGLGFSVRHEETRQKLGTTPLRHLVYRVLELPASMKPLIYDYGGLKDNTEEVYIHRMVANHVKRNAVLGTIPQLTEAITSILSWCHVHMRSRNDECSYVSLRDVERCMIVFSWFHQKFNIFEAEDGFDDMTLHGPFPPDTTTVSVECTMAMILALAVCYYTRLDERSEFETLVVQKFAPPLVLADGVRTFTETITWCQRTFLSNMELGPNIAYNAALRENVFMMTVCVELRIPLFLVGKPGSSKSLAKSVVSTSMKGRASEKRFLKHFKSIELLSYQCSQHSTPQSVIDVFHSAKLIQESEDCSKHVAVVVLDEVGLAEDSPSLPLKALHPLLEDGTDGTDPKEIQVVEREERVGFIGISNWALDPAKMNRGIMVRRGNPDVKELVISARGICSNNEQNEVGDYLQSMLHSLATAYFEIMKSRAKSKQKQDFFGLRDFYSLIKMLHWIISSHSGISQGRDLYLTKEELKHAVLRNFGGLNPKEFQPWDFFKDCCNQIQGHEEVDDPDCDPLGLIEESLNRSALPGSYSENRYLLFLTENDAALQIMQDYLVHTLPKPPYVLFGSSFPKDKDYTQVCRNINQIKICMETGRTIVLLNLDNLYESLYDLLNQYYTTTMDNCRYVDLGLQTHRIKCRVHNDFKLILIAEKSNVYDRFPIPLINRLEKHLVTASTIMTEEQSSICEDLIEWVKHMSSVRGKGFIPEDVFVGYQTETPISVVLQAYKELEDGKVTSIFKCDSESEVLELSKRIMIRMACPDALARLKQTDLMDDAVEIWDIYFKQQQHLSLSQLIQATVSDIPHIDPNETPESSLPPLPSRQNSDSVGSDKSRLGMLLQVTTFSQPLAPVDVPSLCRQLEISKEQLLDMYLEEVEAESDFTDRIRKHVQNVTEGDAYILIQCSLGHLSKDLISCARHKAVDILENLKKDELWKRNYKTRNRKVHVIFVVSLPKQPGGSRFIAFQGGLWMCVHLDDLRYRSPDDNALNFHLAVGTPLSELFYPGQEGVELHHRLDKCLAAAVAVIPYADAQDSSKEDILKILREAFHYRADEGFLTFRDVLVQQHILGLLQKKEKSFLDINEPGWAVREAMNPNRLQLGGTFLNTLLNRVDRELTLALTRILTFVNQHNNLRLYNDDRFRAFWVEIFENHRLCTFSLDNTDVETNEDDPLFKKTRSSRISQYICQMPFSWMFIEAIQADILTFPQSDAVLLRSLYNTSRSSGPGDFLHSTANTFEGLAQLYLEDFVAGVIIPRCPSEAKVLRKYITVLSDALLYESESKPLLLLMLAYHVAYHNNKDEFTRYQELGRTFPDLHEAMLIKVTPDVRTPLDILAVEEVLESKAKPEPASDKEFWQLKNLRDHYIKVLRQCQSTIDEALRNTSHDCHKLRCTWQMIRATQMYIEHLVLPFPNDSEVNEPNTYKYIYQGAFRLWSSLSRSDASFRENVCLGKFRAVIKSVDGVIASTLNVNKPQRQGALDIGHSSADSRYTQYCRAVKILFIEVISVLCFGSGSYDPPQTDLVMSLMQIVVNQEEKRTQDLTPFEWTSADETPVIRSVILQLILMREWDDGFDVGSLIEDVMRRSISLGHDGSEQNHVEMCTLVVRCLEDKACMEWGAVQEGQDAARVFETLRRQIEVSLRPFTEGRSNPSIASYRWLQSVAQLRFSLTVVARVLCDHIMDSPHKQELGRRARTQVSEIIQLLVDVFQRDSFQDLNLFLSKQITRRHGISSLRTLYSQGLRFVLPQQLQSRHAHRSQPDHYIVCGRMYSDVRQSLVQSALDETADAFCAAVQSVDGDQASFVPLAIFSKVVWPTTQVKDFDDEVIQDAMAGCSRQGNLNNKLTAMCHSLLQRDVGGRSALMRPSTDLSSRSLTSLVVHTVATILSKVRHPLLEPFISILNPQQGLAGQYLPTMPEDFIVEAMNIMDIQGQYRHQADMRGKFYACPNGHPYIITECTGPNQRMNCPTCNAHIGSQRGQHQIPADNYPVQRVSGRETGYILGQAATRSASAVPERDLSPAVCAVMRFILHACFMWSACHCSEDALVHLHETVPTQRVSLPEFFWQHLQLDLRVIAKALSRGEDDVVVMLTAVIQTMAECTNTSVNGSMASKDTRNTWEISFSNSVIQPVLSNLNEVISGAVHVITEDSAMAEDEVFLAVYEKTKMTPSLVQTLLTYRSKISIHELTSSLNNFADSKTLYPLLHKFLNEEPLFRALQYLPAVIRLQRVLVDYFAHWQHQNKAERLPIAEAISLATQGTSLNLQNDLEQTRKAWRIVREKLPHHNRKSVPEELVRELVDLADAQPVVYLLPTESGPGRCSLALADYLLYQQNGLLEFCRHTAKFSWFDKTMIPVPELLPSHVVCYEEELDTVILTHCRYSLKFGQGHDIQYDFGALEKHIYDRFLVGKPTIDRATVPIMVYSGDVLQQNVFDRLRKNVKQQPALSHEDQRDVLSKLHRNLAEISRAVKTLTIAISFLASKGRNDPKRSLQKYIISVLKIKNTEFCKKLSLSQLIPLWETLAIEQSQLQSCNGKKIPFNGLDSVKDNFEDLSLDDHHAFEEWLSRFPAPDLWISLLFNFVQLRLTTIASSRNSFEWSLHDVLVECLDEISDSESTSGFKDLSRDLESLPECILVKHAVHVWHLTVQLKVSQ